MSDERKNATEDRVSPDARKRMEARMRGWREGMRNITTLSGESSERDFRNVQDNQIASTEEQAPLNVLHKCSGQH